MTSAWRHRHSWRHTTSSAFCCVDSNRTDFASTCSTVNRRCFACLTVIIIHHFRPTSHPRRFCRATLSRDKVARVTWRVDARNFEAVAQATPFRNRTVHHSLQLGCWTLIGQFLSRDKVERQNCRCDIGLSGTGRAIYSVCVSVLLDNNVWTEWRVT